MTLIIPLSTKDVYIYIRVVLLVATNDVNIRLAGLSERPRILHGYVHSLTPRGNHVHSSSMVRATKDVYIYVVYTVGFTTIVTVNKRPRDRNI